MKNFFKALSAARHRSIILDISGPTMMFDQFIWELDDYNTEAKIPLEVKNLSRHSRIFLSPYGLTTWSCQYSKENTSKFDGVIFMLFDSDDHLSQLIIACDADDLNERRLKFLVVMLERILTVLGLFIIDEEEILDSISENLDTGSWKIWDDFKNRFVVIESYKIENIVGFVIYAEN